jgi:hypothetical protein
VTATELLADLTARDVRLSTVGDRLRVEAPTGVLTAGDRLALVEHKVELLQMLQHPVQTEAQASAQRHAELRRLYLGNGADPALWDVVEPAIAIKDLHGWSDDPDLRQRQWIASDVIDAAYLAGDVDGLRTAVVEFLNLMGT